MYKLGKDLKIKGIENLVGIPDCTIYKTKEIQSIEAGTDPKEFTMVIVGLNGKKPEGFEKW